ALARRPAPERVALPSDFGFLRVEEIGEPPIREALALQLPQGGRVDVVQLLVIELHLQLHDFPDLVEEPRIDAREAVHLIEGEAVLERVAHVPDALGAGLAGLALERLAVARALGQAGDAALWC